MRELTVQEMDCVSGGDVYSGESGLQVYTTVTANNTGGYNINQQYYVPYGGSSSLNFGFNYNTTTSSINNYNLGVVYGGSTYGMSYSSGGTFGGYYGYAFNGGSIGVSVSGGSNGSYSFGGTINLHF